MTEHQTHYPGFDVMREENHWDPHTRKIVNERLRTEPFDLYRFLTRHECDTLYRLCSFLLDDDREPVLSFVVRHFDADLQAGIGESQRKAGVPKKADLVRDGLSALDQACYDRYKLKFVQLDEPVQRHVVELLVRNDFEFPSSANKAPVKDWLEKIRTAAVAAYYSHPLVWSEIGYAGPAYPRGYVRSELGLTDPWEARRDGR